MAGIPTKRDDGGPIQPEWHLNCLECGYDLTGLRGRVCPECGQAFSPRETWEANRAGAAPRNQTRHSRALHLLVVGGVMAVVLAAGQISGHPIAALVAAITILLGEIWILTSDIHPLAPRLIAGTICVFVLLWVLIP